MTIGSIAISNIDPFFNASVLSREASLPSMRVDAVGSPAH